MPTPEPTPAAEPAKELKTIPTKAGPKTFPANRRKKTPTAQAQPPAPQPKPEGEKQTPKSEGMGAGGIAACVVGGLVVGAVALVAVLHFSK